MNGDEQLLSGRVYSAEHNDSHPSPLPHRTYAELFGGPLDGLLLDIHGVADRGSRRRRGPVRPASRRTPCTGARRLSLLLLGDTP
jgi:hypothetical protein